MAAVIKFSFSRGASAKDCSSELTPTFTVSGNSIVNTSQEIRTKYELDSLFKTHYCYVWVETIIDGTKLPSPIYINTTQNGEDNLESIAVFGLLSTPMNTRVLDENKSVVNFLQSRAMYCARFDHSRISKAMVFSEPKSFQYSSSSSRRASDLSFTNLLHFTAKDDYFKYSGFIRDIGSLNVELNFFNQRAYMVHLQPIWHIVLVIVVIIVVAIVLVPWIRIITFILISNFRRSILWRCMVLLGWFVVFFGVTLLVAQIDSILVIVVFCHFIFLFIAIMLNMIVQGKCYGDAM